MNQPVSARHSTFLLVLAFIGFISLGLPDAVIGVAWPSVRDTFRLRQEAIALVLVISGIGYLASSFLAGRLMQSMGIGLVLAASTGLVSAHRRSCALGPSHRSMSGGALSSPVQLFAISTITGLSKCARWASTESHFWMSR